MEEIRQFLALRRRQLLKGAILFAPLVCLATVGSLALSDVGHYHYQPTAAAAPEQAKQQQPVADPSKRAILPIFGKMKVEEASKLSNSNLPTTALNLTLHAIFFSTESDHGSALISKQGQQKAKLYKIGGTIMKGVRLEKVLVNSVVIDRNGNSESLKLPRLGGDDT